MEGIKQLTSWLFPPHCLMCEQALASGLALCPYCLNDLPLFAANECYNLLLRPDVKRIIKVTELDGLCALGWYRPPLSHWLSGFKFHNQAIFALAIRQVIEHQLQRMALLPEWEWPQLFCLLPLHRRRFYWRGFNQVQQTWRYCLPETLIRDDILMRKVATRAQTKLSAKARRKNLNNAFEVRADIKGLSVVVVDDVVTTGASLNAAAKALKQAGAEHVFGWATCITPKG